MGDAAKTLNKAIGKYSDPADVFGGKAAAAGIESSERLGYEALEMQRDWQEWIKETFGPYSEVAQEALGQQKALAGLGGEDVRQQAISDIQADPLYQAKIAAGDEAVLRGASATGGLRSGDASSALSLQNQALLEGEIQNRYNRLAGLSGQGFMGQQAQGTFGTENISQMATTLGGIASGQLAAGQAASTRGAGLASGIMGAIFSDRRLKENVVKIGEENGLNVYTWTWNNLAKQLFKLSGFSQGHMADEVEKIRPDLVGHRAGFKTVNYGGLSNGV